jgi:hypothetical protein
MMGTGLLLSAILPIILMIVLLESRMGRLWLGPDGRFGIWEGIIWSNECSQRLFDPYSFSHIAHGLIFFFILRVFAGRLPVQFRYLIALMVESSWELLENSPLIINRYREATIALGYCGDSILNSLSDILMMSFGFILAGRLPVWAGVLLLLIMETACAIACRDNLTLNVIMLIHPVEAIRVWQMQGH